MNIFTKFFNKIKAGFYVIRYLSTSLVCEATGRTFWLPTFIEESLVLPDIYILDDKAVLEVRSQLYKLSNQKILEKETTIIIDTFPSMKIIPLIWERYGVLHPSLTIYLIGFYGTKDKETAEQMASSYCTTYLNMTINPVLENKNKFFVDVLPSAEGSIRLKGMNEECSYEFSSPQAMPNIVSDISEKYIGLN